MTPRPPTNPSPILPVRKLRPKEDWYRPKRPSASVAEARLEIKLRIPFIALRGLSRRFLFSPQNPAELSPSWPSAARIAGDPHSLHRYGSLSRPEAPPPHAPWPHLEPRLGVQHHGASPQLQVQQRLLQVGQGHEAPIHLGEKRGGRRGDVRTEEWTAWDRPSPGSSARLTVTAPPCSSLTATSPSSTATSWVQATRLRPRSLLVTCTLRCKGPECNGQQERV